LSNSRPRTASSEGGDSIWKLMVFCAPGFTSISSLPGSKANPAVPAQAGKAATAATNTAVARLRIPVRRYDRVSMQVPLESYRGQGDHRGEGGSRRKVLRKGGDIEGELHEIVVRLNVPQLADAVAGHQLGAGVEIVQRAIRACNERRLTVGYRERTESVGDVVEFSGDC